METMHYSLMSAIQAYAYATGQLQLGHLCTDAMAGEDWARNRITAALAAIDTTRPDGAVARKMSSPI